MVDVTNVPRACVVGAGSSGIAAAKALHDAGIAFDCFEKGERVGGNWVFENSNGMSSAYRSLHINTSRERMQYSDFPMPKDYPDFPHHSLIAAYFDAYVDHFGFRDRIAFETGVDRAVRDDDGSWVVTLDSGEARRYDALVVANGHHWDPQWPDPPFPGTFDGVESHSHHYKDNKDLEGKRVLVVGMGNSAMDIAVEAADVAERVYLSCRRGAHVIPKYLFGKPLDQIATIPGMPFRLRQLFFTAALRIAVGKMESYGLPKPDHRILEAHPTISGVILDRLGHGDVRVKPNIAERLGSKVRFVDGTMEEVDAIIYCTGYRVTFPFFDGGFLAAPGNDFPLFKRVFEPRFDNLFFIGLLQPLGAIMPLAEAQSRWVCELIRGDYALPSRKEMERDIRRDRDAMARRYVASKRHTMQVDFDDYLLELRAEIERGRRRARRQRTSAAVRPFDSIAPRRNTLEPHS
jgi:dimethylaniline monooxygenase (N-oxide forming)